MRLPKSKLGLVLPGTYLLFMLSDFLYTIYKCDILPNSRWFCGSELFFFAMPWIYVKGVMGFIQSLGLQYSFVAFLHMILNAIILYFIGSRLALHRACKKDPTL